MNYIHPMNSEWDEAKSEVCFAERGFDFAYAARAFFDQNIMSNQSNQCRFAGVSSAWLRQ